ncbi:MAG: hypothetical protein Q4E35_00945 [Eubacteriales bacterium]|nr:hypothetical protein [Eubacteriales bacterium]
MKKKSFFAIIFVLVLLFTLMALLTGCDRKSDEADTAGTVLNDAPVGTTEPAETGESAVETEKISDEQALSAIRYYCLSSNPNLESIVNSGEYPVYWEISAGDERETVVLFRAYTGALVRYYIDRLTGDTYVTEFVPGITPEEQRTDESFNVRDYISD